MCGHRGVKDQRSKVGVVVHTVSPPAGKQRRHRQERNQRPPGCKGQDSFEVRTHRVLYRCLLQGDEGPEGEKGTAGTPGTPVSWRPFCFFLETLSSCFCISLSHGDAVLLRESPEREERKVTKATEAHGSVCLCVFVCCCFDLLFVCLFVVCCFGAGRGRVQRSKWTTRTTWLPGK